MIRQGMSWSGRERNCCYLGTESKRFVDSSAVSGFDFLDDARGVVATDWDFDGDLDLWIANPSAPQMRFLHNDSPVGARQKFVSFQLRGTKCHPDAIGARVEVHLENKRNPAGLSRFSRKPSRLIRKATMPTTTCGLALVETKDLETAREHYQKAPRQPRGALQPGACPGQVTRSTGSPSTPPARRANQSGLRQSPKQSQTRTEHAGPSLRKTPSGLISAQRRKHDSTNQCVSLTLLLKIPATFRLLDSDRQTSVFATKHFVNGRSKRNLPTFQIFTPQVRIQLVGILRPGIPCVGVSCPVIINISESDYILGRVNIDIGPVPAANTDHDDVELFVRRFRQPGMRRQTTTYPEPSPGQDGTLQHFAASETSGNVYSER